MRCIQRASVRKSLSLLGLVGLMVLMMIGCGGVLPSASTASPVVKADEPLPSNTVVDQAQIPSVVLGAVDEHRGDLPIRAILGIIAQETGGIAYENSGDGVMQVTTGAGSCRSQLEAYKTTVENITRNIQDGICVLHDQYTRNSENLIYAIWKYNGGENPYDTYDKGLGDREYLDHVASRLTCNQADSRAWVARDFGLTYCDEDLATQLMKAQELVSNKALSIWPDGSCIQSINCPDRTRPISIIAPPGEFKKTSESNRPPGFRASDSTWWFNAGTWSIPVTDTDPGPMSSGLEPTGCYYRIENFGGQILTGSRTCNAEFEVRVGPPEDDQVHCFTEGLKMCTVYVGSRDRAGNESQVTQQAQIQLSVDYTPPGAR